MMYTSVAWTTFLNLYTLLSCTSFANQIEIMLKRFLLAVLICEAGPDAQLCVFLLVQNCTYQAIHDTLQIVVGVITS